MKGTSLQKMCTFANLSIRYPPVLAAISRNAQTERIVEAAVIKYVTKNELPVKTGYANFVCENC